MKRFIIATVLVAALGTSTSAQPVPDMIPPTPPPPAVYHPDVYIPPGAQPGSAIPFHKSGGVVAGAYGFYPYDTGDWLLADMQGLTRQRGSFTMVYPGVFPAPAPKKHFQGKYGMYPR